MPTDLRSRRELHRQTPRAPIAGALLESPGDFVTARSTPAVSKIPFAEFVPIALDEQLTATGTPRAAAFAIMNVSGINIVQPFRVRDLSRASQRRGWRVRFVEHFEIGMERSEMPRHIGPEIFREPLSRVMQLRVAVVLAWNQQCSDFKPDVRFAPEIFQRVEHGPKLSKTKPVIKRIGERFKIDIRRVHVPVKFGARIIGNVTGGHRERFNPAFVARLRHIDRVLGKNHRIIVGERDRAAPEPFRRACDLLRRRGIGELVPLPGFGDVPVLAKPAAKIASRRAE